MNSGCFEPAGTPCNERVPQAVRHKMPEARFASFAPYSSVRTPVQWDSAIARSSVRAGCRSRYAALRSASTCRLALPLLGPGRILGSEIELHRRRASQLAHRNASHHQNSVPLEPRADRCRDGSSNNCEALVCRPFGLQRR